MDREINATADNVISSLGAETAHGELVIINNAGYYLLKQMEPVYAGYLNAYRIENVGRCLEIIDSNNGVTLLGCGTDGIRTVAAVDGDIAVRVFESDNFAARHRVAMRT